MYQFGENPQTYITSWDVPLPRRYVSCSVSDGLGNRLFQIMAMLGYAEKYGHTPVFIREWIKDNPTQPGGNRVCTLFPTIQTMTLESVVGEWSYLRPPFMDAMTYVELPRMTGHVKLEGYFQSARYFPRCLPVFAGLVPLSISQPSLFLHVRRGDYLHPLNTHHYVDLASYYERALALFPEDALVYVCSDDIEWCKITLPGRYGSVVGAHRWRWVVGDEFETLSVMMGCSLGGMCANSTFSWWGAWLNPSTEKIVCMPDVWIHPRPGHPLPRDLYPEGVLRV
jgi:Glycosyl transferase family 11